MAIEGILEGWKSSLLEKLPVDGLLARNKVAYKWKALFRCWMLREACLWRIHDLLDQSLGLYRQEQLLGARILLRSAFETLATLIYLNMLVREVIGGAVNFHVFCAKTGTLLMGSRDNPDLPFSINIVTILSKCDKRYPGIAKVYAGLSESAHPSYEGLLQGYCKIDHDEYEATFYNRWAQLHAARHQDKMMMCAENFYFEYDRVWPEGMEDLESWVEAHDAELEATKNDPLPKT